MSSEIKVESNEDGFALAAGHMPELETKIEEQHQFVTNEDDQFDADNELAMAEYADAEEPKEHDIIGNLMVDDAGESFEASGEATYITMDDGTQGEQFLTIPRGNTQITVCDNGNIVYSDESIANAVNADLDDKSQVMATEEGQTYYYEEQPEEQIQMETEEAAEYTDEAIVGTEVVEEAEAVEGNETYTVAVSQAPGMMQLGDSVLSHKDLRNIMMAQDGQRGVKRSIVQTSQSKNIVTKVFIQNNPNSSQQNQPIKIIGNIGSVVGATSMSLKQAQRLGLIGANTKIQKVSQSPVANPGRMIVKKMMPSSPSSFTLKSPTKILPAPPTKVQVRSPATVIRGNVPVSNFTPIRTNLPFSQLKAFNTISTNSGQMRPAVVTRTLGGLTFAKTDGKLPQKIFVRPGNSHTVVSPVSGQITRVPVSSSFQQVQIGGKQPQVQYLRVVSPGNSLVSGVRPKVMKPITTRTVPMGPVPVLPKPATTVLGKRLYLSAGEQKSPVSIPLSLKSKYTTIKNIQVQDRTTADDVILLDEEFDKSEKSDDVDELYEKDNVDEDSIRGTSPTRVLEANGIRPKKPCNCTKSQCLKLYCECFANGEFCFQCNCHNCFNNIEHEEERQFSIKSCLERNPGAFRPKFQMVDSDEEERRHNKGCNCKRSGCLKNYCECFEAKIPCSKTCKCAGCKNTEDGIDRNDNSSGAIEQKIDDDYIEADNRFMSPSLKDAFCNCIASHVEAASTDNADVPLTERRMIEEFGQCLAKIIGNWTKKDSKV